MYMLQMKLGMGWINIKVIDNEHAAVITRDAYRARMNWTVDYRLLPIV